MSVKSTVLMGEIYSAGDIEISEASDRIGKRAVGR